MKKPNLILAIAALAAASLSLPVTASADTYKHTETTVVRNGHGRDAYVHPVHNANRYTPRHHASHQHGRWVPPRYQHNHGHHYGHYTQGYRYDYRPVVRHPPLHLDDVRVRIFYDLHL